MHPTSAIGSFHFAWMAILLLAYFDLFWQSDFFVTINDWRFPDFLFVVTGPIVLLIATHVLLASAVVSGGDPPGTEDSLLGRRFLGLAIGSQAWFFVASMLYAGGPTKANLFELTLATILAAMFASRRPRTHAIGTVAVAVVYVGALALLGLPS